MNNNQLMEEKIYSALRSLFRYHQMLENNMPNIIVEAEADILTKRMQLLSANGIYELVSKWPTYKAEQMANSEIEDRKLDQFLLTLN